jgi:hypothetical protein
MVKRCQQSLAADGAIACFSSNLFPFSLKADRAPQLKAGVMPQSSCFAKLKSEVKKMKKSLTWFAIAGISVFLVCFVGLNSFRPAQAQKQEEKSTAQDESLGEIVKKQAEELGTLKAELAEMRKTIEAKVKESYDRDLKIKSWIGTQNEKFKTVDAQLAATDQGFKKVGERFGGYDKELAAHRLGLVWHNDRLKKIEQFLAKRNQ